MNETKDPQHIDLVDRYLRLIPDSAGLGLESFYPQVVAGIYLPHQGVRVVDSYNCERWCSSVFYAELKSIPSEPRVLLCCDYITRTGVRDDVFIDEVPGNDGDLVNLLPNGMPIHCNTIHAIYINDTLKRYSQDITGP